MTDIQSKLAELGLSLPDTPQPAANYVPSLQAGDLVFLSGQTPKIGTELRYKGKLGQDFSTKEGYAAAQLCTLRLISALQAQIGNLDRVKKIVKLTVFVNGTPEFEEHALVANGASDLLIHLFGEAGKHARAAVGAGSLPGLCAVEIEMVVQVSTQ